MNCKQQITPELLNAIASLLGNNWRYNHILSIDSDNHGHYLSNGEGLIINVYYEYGEKLPQWAIKYPHPRHKHLQKHYSIGCSIHKSKSAIVEDLKNRLLTHTGAAFLAWKKLVESEGNKIKDKEIDNYIIESIKKVLNLNPYYNHQYCYAYRIENEHGTRIADLKKWGSKGDSFKLSIDDLTAEKVIKIMQIVNC